MLLALTLSTIVAVPAQARAGIADASSLVAELGNRTLAILHETQPTSSSRYEQFHELVVEKFDVPVLAQFVAGRFWQSATAAERNRFTAAFENYMTELFSGRFAHYTKQTFAIRGQHAEADGTAIVSSEIIEPTAASGDRVDWRVTNTSNGIKITDVFVSGVSVAQTKREEFGSVLERKGISALTVVLEHRFASQAQSATRAD